jgi:hypothetical protein
MKSLTVSHAQPPEQDGLPQHLRPRRRLRAPQRCPSPRLPAKRKKQGVNGDGKSVIDKVFEVNELVLTLVSRQWTAEAVKKGQHLGAAIGK